MENSHIEELKTKVDELESKISFKYNNEGILLHKETNEHVGRLDKKEYEMISAYVEKYIQYVMQSKLQLRELHVPRKKTESVTETFTLEPFAIKDKSLPQCAIYISPEYEQCPSGKALCLIQGTGAVRPGQWGRSVCINESLLLGSMIPYIEDGIKNGMSIIILNPNQRNDEFNQPITQFNSMQNHTLYVYEHLIKPNKNIKEIYFVSHSMGGQCTIELMKRFKEDFSTGLIKKIAFTDSVHGASYNSLDKDTLKILRSIGRNYVTSSEPVGSQIGKWEDTNDGVDHYSSGHNKHEYTSGTAREVIFKWFKE